MALSTVEGTKKETLDLMKIPGAGSAGYIMLTRVEVDFNGKNFTALILSYTSEEQRRVDLQSAHPYWIGGPLTDVQFAEMAAAKDIRAVLYPEIEKLIVAHLTPRVKEPVGKLS